MSVPVVCATMLAAMCAPQLRRQRQNAMNVALKNYALSQKYDKTNGAILAERGDLYKLKKAPDAKDFIDVFRDIARELGHDAYRSSVLCTCESSGTTATDPKILECAGCGFCCCHDCSSRYQLSNHTMQDIHICDGEGARPDPHVFERRLRRSIPSVLQLGQGWENNLENGQALTAYSFQLQQVERKKGNWQLIFGAWEDHGSDRQVGEIRVLVGKTKTLDTAVGVVGYLRNFAPAIRHNNPHRGKLKDSARIILKASDETACWEVPNKQTKCTLKLKGKDTVDSQRVLAGLNDNAARSLRNHTVKRAFIPPVQSRNPTTHYHKLWKTWPKTIVVSDDPSGRVNGTYHIMSCTHTVVLSALWRRENCEGQSPMYLFYRPDVLRTNLDVAVFSPTPSYADNMEVAELHDWIPENALVDSTHLTKAKFLEWKSVPDVRVEVPQPVISMVSASRSYHEEVDNAPQDDETGPVLCQMRGFCAEAIDSLLEYTDAEDGEQDSATIDLFGKSGTRNAKRLSIIAAPYLVKFAAQGQLPLTFGQWYQLQSINFGNSEIHVPPRPVERWQMIAEREGRYERVYDSAESNEYYQRLANRPQAFHVAVDKQNGQLTIRMNPNVVALRAAALLGGEGNGSIRVDYCLQELSSMGEPQTKPFNVPNSDAYNEANINGLLLPLYPRQAKALTRMLEIESGKVDFSEEELSESIIPGIGWCLIGKAKKESPLRGGVLGDAIGSGKTVVTIALILAGAAKARQNRDIKRGVSSATLIVVPPGLVRQWDDERKVSIKYFFLVAVCFVYF